MIAQNINVFFEPVMIWLSIAFFSYTWMICCCIGIACEQALLGLAEHPGRACSQASINDGKLNNKKSSLHFNQYWSWAKNTETKIVLEFITIGLVILIVTFLTR